MRTRSSVLILSLACACAAEDPSDAERAGFFAADDVIEGPLQILVADMKDGTAQRIHRVVVDGEPIVLDLEDAPALAPRSLVRAWGSLDGGSFTVDGLELVAPPPAPLIDADPFAPRKIATILLHFGSPDIGADEARTKMFEGPTSTHDYFAEISYGKESMTGDVFGPYQITYPGWCDSDGFMYSAIEAMQSAGVDPDAYAQLMYVFPDAGCGWGGLAMLGSPQQEERDSWYNGMFDCVVRNQELAHNYGLNHTHFYYGCVGGGPFGSSCNYEEYGSPYEPMGYGCGHMAAPQKHYMGWLEGCNLVSATADGVFNLVPLETPCNGVQALRLPTFDGRDYYLEYRRPIGFDAEQAGVLVHVSGGWDWYGPDPFLIDLGEGGFLRAGESYTDPGEVVTFTVLEEHDTHAVIQATFPGGGAGAPTCEGGGAPPQQAGVFGTLECLGGPFQPDAVAPTVSIASPHDGDVLEPGSDLAVEVTAQDDVGVASVTLRVDGQLAEARTEPPWSWHFDGVPEGMHEIVAIASDGVNESESAAVVIDVREGGGGGTAGSAGEDDGGDGGASDAGEDDGDGGSGVDDDGLPPGFGLDGEQTGCGCSSHGGGRLAPLVVVAALARRRRRAYPCGTSR